MGYMMEKKHTLLGKISLVLSIISIVGGILVITLTGNTVSPGTFYTLALLIAIPALFGLFAIVLGATVYWSKERDEFGLIAFIIGLVSLHLNGLLIMLGMFSAMP